MIMEPLTFVSFHCATANGNHSSVRAPFHLQHTEDFSAAPGLTQSADGQMFNRGCQRASCQINHKLLS